MKKVIVIGCPGSGKSTFSKKLAEATSLPLYHLDMMYWNPDKTKVEKELFRKHLADVMAMNEWIIDGNYASTMEWRMEACDTVIFLDYPMEVCLEGLEARRGKPRTDMPWIEPENDVDEEFVAYVKAYNTENRPQVMALLEKHDDKEIVIFKSRREAENFWDGKKG